MTTVVAAYGYIAADEDPRHWQPHGVVREPRELLAWVDQRLADAIPVSA
jgi:phosphoglycolate phosphatase-like HAD superfamily hydrolase